jgi:mannose-6-phosphate isomerase-like protein (cupin superfamily)
MAIHPITRVVTGHDGQGKSIITHIGPLPTVLPLANIPGTLFHEVWSTGQTPALIDNAPDPTLTALCLPPPENGTRIRMVDIPPDTPEFLASGAAHMRDAFGELGDASASTVTAASPHPLMHRTESVDYGVVLEGEIVLVLDRGEVLLRRGDVVVQRGTNHAWANRSGSTARMLFVLIDGHFGADTQGGLATAGGAR